MKRSVFYKDGLYVEYAFHREGPPHQFICCYRGASWLIFDQNKVLKQFKLSKGTPTRDALTQWLEALALKDHASDTQTVTSPDKEKGGGQGLVQGQSWDPLHSEEQPAP